MLLEIEDYLEEVFGNYLLSLVLLYNLNIKIELKLKL